MPGANATSVSPPPRGWDGADRLCLGLLAGITLIRCAALVASPLELGVDEAQYWLWGTAFDFGYYTKPPLTSWIIALSHGMFGHYEWAVRMPAPWLHLATCLVLWRAAVWAGGDDGTGNGAAARQAGRLAALLWVSLPAVGVGSFVISTDTPLLLGWSLGLLGLIGVITGRVRPVPGMAFAGAGFGAAMLAKYAAIYGLAGLVLFLALMRARKAAGAITPGGVLVFAAAMLLVASPNIIWNLMNELATVRHLGDNANLDRQSYNVGNSLAFLGAQFATAGPLVFALMLGALRVRRIDQTGALLLCLSVPVIAVIMLQAFLSEANANWALAAMPALVIWLARWLAAGRGRLALAATGTNMVIAATLVAVTAMGSLGLLTPQSDPLRRLRGWQELASDTHAALRRHQAGTVIADRRATAALLSWHFHGGGIEILVHDADGVPSNHFEQNMAWDRTPGRRVLLLDGRQTPPAMDGLIWSAGPVGLSRTSISAQRDRTLYLHAGVEAGG
ncbi:MAG: ArnT family glycosyltransferase [Candidatus Puniceispirillaceae bacterium]